MRRTSTRKGRGADAVRRPDAAGTATLPRLLSAGSSRTSVSQLANKLRHLRVDERTELVAACETAMQSRKSRNQRTRIALVKILLALLPDSEDAIERLVRSRRLWSTRTEVTPKMSRPEA